MRHWLLLIPIVVAVLSWPETATDPAPTPVADHHIHIPSEATAKYLRDAADFDIEAKSGEDVVRFLDEAQVETGVLLSLAYMFGRPGTNFENEYGKVRRENDYVARQAAEYPDRLVAFCSVNPLAEYAVKEIERCARKPHLKGLKLQLANSKVDLRDTTDVHRLAEVFGTANQRRLPIVVHLWTGSEYGRKDAEIFIRRVLPEASDVTVQVAHMGGKGMFDNATVAALKAFEEAMESGEVDMKNVIFDLGAVTADPSRALAKGDTTRAEGYRTTHRRTARWVKRLGPDRVVFGSDYFARSVPDYVATLRALPIEERVLRDVFDNTAAYLQDGSS